MKTTLLVALLAVGCAAAWPARAQTTPTQRVYIANDDHTDYMWAGNEEAYRLALPEMVDYYLNQADATSGNPSPFQSRFNLDGNFWVWLYEKERPAADFNRLIGRLRDGHVSMPLNTLVSVYGGTPAEGVLRSMYYAGRLERRYGLRFSMAHAQENQTLPLGLGALWAGAGAKYSWRGICNCATRTTGLGNREHEIYWHTGLDGSRVLMKWNSLYRTVNPASTDPNQAMGGYAEARFPRDIVNFCTRDAAFKTKYPYAVAGAFGYGWDDLKTFTNAFVTTAQDSSQAGRQVIVSNEQDFFQDFETTHGAGLPAVTAAYGNEWELALAAYTEASAQTRRATEKLRSAEALAALVSLKTPGFLSGREAARDQTWQDLGLFYEHNMGGGQAGIVPDLERFQFQQRKAAAISSYVNTLHADAQAALAGLIAKTGANQRFYAFNPLGWVRTDYAEVAYSGSGPVHAVDVSTGQQVPAQLLNVSGEQRLRVLAPDLPAVGYKVFEIRAGAGSTSFANAATVSGSVIENEFYKLTVSGTGAITSWLDKTRSNREMVRIVGGRVVNDLGGSGGSVVVENAGPVSVTLKATAPAPFAHTTRITLLRGSRRVSIENHITQNFGGTQTWAYSFNLDAPDTWHEETGAVIRAKLTSQGGHYAARNAAYDWLSFGHFADMSAAGANVGVTLSNADCHYMKLGSSTLTRLDAATPQVSAVAGMDYNNFTNQMGVNSFLQRFALQTHGAYNGAQAMRFALEHQNPVTAALLTGADSAYPEATYSLLSVSDPNVVLWSVKPAEEGIQDGLIARVWNQAGAGKSFTLSTTPALLSAQQTTHLETNLGNVAVAGSGISATAGAYAMQTYRLKVDAASTPPAPAPVLAINVGGGAVGNFGADQGASGGNLDSTPNPISTAGVAGAAPASLYQTQRYGTFTYTLAGLTAGTTYPVRLHFAEDWWGVDGRGGGSGTGQRLLNVTANGTVVISNLDVFVAAGGANKALVKEFSATANAAGTITLGFGGAPGSPDQNAIVSGIEVYAPATATPAAPVFALNAGGGAFTAANGMVYAADAAYASGGGTYMAAGTAIANTTDDALYQSERYGNFSYALPVANGRYDVTLQFAEIYWQAAGQRQFDVLLEGQEAVSNLDVFGQVGRNSAYDLTRTVAVTDGQLNIQLRTDVDNAKLSALVVRPAAAARPATPLAAVAAPSPLRTPLTVAPNPFGGRTTVRYELARPERVRLEVFDALGRRVALLHDGAQAAGPQQVEFDAHRLPAGTYFCRLRTDTASAACPLVLR